MMVATFEKTSAIPLKSLNFKRMPTSFRYEEERVNVVSAAMENDLSALKEKLLSMASYA